MMGFFPFERLQSWRYIRPLPTPPNAHRSRWYRIMKPADLDGWRRNPRASWRKSVASNSSLPATLVRRVRSSLGLAEAGKGRGRRAAATTTSAPSPSPSPSPSPPPFKASHSSSLPSSPTPFDDGQHRRRKGTIVYDRFKSALQQLFAPPPAPAVSSVERKRGRGQKTPPATAAAAAAAASKTKRKRERKGDRRRRAKKSAQICDDEDELLPLSAAPSSNLSRRRRDVRITPARIPTVPAPVWPEYLYSYDDGDSAPHRTIFAPAASNLNFGLVTHSLSALSARCQTARKEEKRKGAE